MTSNIPNLVYYQITRFRCITKNNGGRRTPCLLYTSLEGKIYLTPQFAGEIRETLEQGPQRSGDPLDSITLRQREVLQLLAEGHPAKAIASRLSISTRTVEFHKYQMMETLGLHTNAELIHFAIRQGLVDI